MPEALYVTNQEPRNATRFGGLSLPATPKPFLRGNDRQISELAIGIGRIFFACTHYIISRRGDWSLRSWVRWLSSSCHFRWKSKSRQCYLRMYVWACFYEGGMKPCWGSRCRAPRRVQICNGCSPLPLPVEVKRRSSPTILIVSALTYQCYGYYLLKSVDDDICVANDIVTQTSSKDTLLLLIPTF